jgi:NADH dehydrogenase FAD-containing subunit/pimeloyl-ACP methyl ester carboxylesterase
MKERPQGRRVVIIGGGFGGLRAAKALANEAVDVTLIDRKNHHIFQPLLYQVALGVLSPGEIAMSLRHILRKARNVRTILGEVAEFDTASRRVKLIDGGEITYDYLIIAAGARHAYFGHDEWEKDAPGLKTIENAVDIRSRLLRTFEAAERSAHLTGRQDPLNFAVIGGGPTGVELAGAIADLARLALAKDFKAIDTTKARVRLYEGSPRVLGTYSEDSSRKAQQQLEQLGVEVYTNSMVTAVEEGRIKVRDEWIETDVALWVAGVYPSSLGKQLRAPTDRAGRVLIEQDLSVPGHPEIFVIGDMAALTDASGTPVPGLGAAAVQEGKAAAQNILRDLRGNARLSFIYQDWGILATIGHHRAVAQFGHRTFSGFIAWLLWALVHIVLLIGFRNRVAVMSQWVWTYLTRQGSSPLITEYPRRGFDVERASFREYSITNNKRNQRRNSMPYITVKDGTEIYYKDWGQGPVVTFSHGWPLNSNAWDGQMLFLAQNGFRVVAHDRRGHGRSSQASSGNDMNGYADDLAAVIEALDLTDATLVGHSTGGGEVARYVARHGTKRVVRVVLIAAVPPILLKSATNTEGLPMEVFDNLRSGMMKDRSQFYKDMAVQFYGANRAGAKVSQGMLDQFWLWSMQAGLKSAYESIKAFSETDQTEDLKKFDVPTLVIHGEDDQIVPVKDSAKKSARLITGAREIYYPGAPHGITATHQDQINTNLLSFLKEQRKVRAAS